MRRKSESQKRRFIFLSATGVTLVIACFWGVALAFRINSGAISFELSPSENSEIRNLGQKLNDSWNEFFADIDDGSTTTVSSTEAQYPALEEMFGGRRATSSESDRDSEPDVILDEPQTEYYPADIYSN